MFCPPHPHQCLPVGRTSAYPALVGMGHSAVTSTIRCRVIGIVSPWSGLKNLVKMDITNYSPPLEVIPQISLKGLKRGELRLIS
jgi:hypothetical protein